MKKFKLPILLIALLALPFLQACKGPTLAPGGAYAPATITTSTNAAGVVTTNTVATAAPDPAFEAVDQTFDTTYSMLDDVLVYERANRKALEAISPSIKHSLDAIRPGAWLAVQAYTSARRTYIANPTPAGLTTLQTILSQVQALAAAAQTAQATVATNTAPPAVPPPAK